MTMMKKSKKKELFFLSPLFCSFVDDRDDVKKHTSSAAARACVCGYEETSQKKQTSTRKTTQPTLFSLYIYE